MANKTVTFNYVKSDLYHTAHVNGVIGATAPDGNLHLTFFREELPDVYSETYAFTDEALKLDNRDVDEDFTRVMETCVTMSPETAESLIGWLTARVQEHKARKAEAFKKNFIKGGFATTSEAQVAQREAREAQDAQGS